MQHVTLAERAAITPAPSAENVCRCATQKRLDNNPPLHAQITARPGTRRPAAKHLARLRLERGPLFDTHPVESSAEIRTRQRECRSLRKDERAAQQRHLESGCLLRISQQPV